MHAQAPEQETTYVKIHFLICFTTHGQALDDYDWGKKHCFFQLDYL